MPTPSAPLPPGTATYVRGEVVREVDRRRVARCGALLGLLVMVGLVVATTIGAAHRDWSQRQLQRAGVPVVATVTQCRPVTSGIGQAVQYYVCTAAYTLDGDHHRAVLDGSRVLRPLGQRLQAVTVRGHPGLLATTAVATKRFRPWTPYVTPIVLAGLTVLAGLGLFWWSRRRRQGQ